MKARFTLSDMDVVKFNHIRANLDFWKWDLVLEARKFLRRLEKSRLLKVSKYANPQAKLALEMLRTKGELAVDDINQVVNYSVKSSDRTVVFELYVAPVYFASADAMSNQLGKHKLLKRMFKVFGRQELVDLFASEIKKNYTNNYHVEILDDDGEKLVA